MTQVHHRSAIFFDLVENIVSEQLDDIAIARLGPARVVVESVIEYNSNTLRNSLNGKERSPLWSFVDESEFTKQPHQAAIFQLAHELRF